MGLTLVFNLVLYTSPLNGNVLRPSFLASENAFSKGDSPFLAAGLLLAGVPLAVVGFLLGVLDLEAVLSEPLTLLDTSLAAAYKPAPPRANFIAVLSLVAVFLIALFIFLLPASRGLIARLS